MECPKAIHKAKGYLKVRGGNHSVKMRHRLNVSLDKITLYHFNVRDYKETEKKAIRWKESNKFLLKNNGGYDIVDDLESGTLRKNYFNQYSSEIREFLISKGHVTKHLKLINYFTYKNIVCKYSADGQS